MKGRQAEIQEQTTKTGQVDNDKLSDTGTPFSDETNKHGRRRQRERHEAEA